MLVITNFGVEKFNYHPLNVLNAMIHGHEGILDEFVFV
jgi:hypothetical protein